MSRTRAVIFDFGGTLFTYESASGARGGQGQRFAEVIGYEGDPAAMGQAIRDGFARAMKESAERPFYLHRDAFAAGWKYAARSLGGALTEDEALGLGHEMVFGMLRGISPRPGMHDTLSELRRRGLHVGAASNSDEDQFEAMVEALDARSHFDSLLCSETVRSCKPDPGIFLEALRRAGCQPAEAVFVGDAPDMDIAGAERLGMRAVLITEPSRIPFIRGTAKDGQLTIDRLPQLLDLV